MTKLIVDSGSTKITWAYIYDEKEPVFYESTGINPVYYSPDETRIRLLSLIPKKLKDKHIDEIYFYGAGIIGEFKDNMQAALEAAYPGAGKVFTGSDLLGAARALLGHNQGFVAILGTGMNTCIYNGEAITHRISPLGFILGDEGSGAYIGKIFLKNILRKEVPGNILEEFRAEFNLTDSDIIRQIYSGKSPNRFCAKFCKFISDRIKTVPYCHNLIYKAFDDFFQNIVSHYPDYKNYSFNCVGSVAFYNKDILKEVAENYGMKTGIVIKSPIEYLTAFHSKE